MTARGSHSSTLPVPEGGAPGDFVPPVLREGALLARLRRVAGFDHWLPLFVFVGVAAATTTLYQALREREQSVIGVVVAERAAKIRELIGSKAVNTLQVLSRMGQRWDAAGGTPYEQWRADAANHLGQVAGIEAFEWVDASGHIRWAEPSAGNEQSIGREVRFEATAVPPRTADAPGAALAPFLDFTPGNGTIVAYCPVSSHGHADGLLAAVLSADEMFARIGRREMASDFEVVISFRSQTLFRHPLPAGEPAAGPVNQGTVQVNERAWLVTVTPGKEFVASLQSWLPEAALGLGMLIALLLAALCRAELIARRHVGALITSEETFRSAMDSASIGMALVRPDGGFMRVNPALCALLGYEPHQLLGTDLQSLTHPEDLERDLQCVQRSLAGESGRYRLEKRYFHSSGRTIWTLLSASLVRDSAGRPSYFVAQIQDIGEQKEVERLKSEFVSVVSHELRTPLTSVRGALGLMAGPLATDLPHKFRELLGVAHSNCERLIVLINDILDIDKVAAGKMRFDIQEVRLADVTRRAVEAIGTYAHRYQVGVELDPIDPELRVAVDEDRFVQVVTNLLSNAVKFSPRGRRVLVDARAANGRVRVRVVDRGAGIPEEFRARIFEKFSQADSSSGRRAGGTGLGLHISRQIVEHMQGKIGFETRQGRGTTFWVELALLPAPAAAPRLPAPRALAES
jgi:PAS domain S-box-containing protein